VGGGLTLGTSLGKAKPGNYSYHNFRTKRPVNFDDFNSKGARITSISASLGIGYTWTRLTIFTGSNILGSELAGISWRGLKFGKVAIQAQAGVHGGVGVKYGNGQPHGLFSRVLNIPDVFEKDDIPRRAHYRIYPRESPIITLPDDVLFDFNSDRLKTVAFPFLKRTIRLIESRNQGQVIIEGHTDSTGNSQYNKRLSLRRAKAVKLWFIQQNTIGSHGFIIRGIGESKPVASNKLPDGTSNKDGQKKNRRVEILFSA
jgi:outer membrane protein OmpA-like peptidoglycan-associated protein